MKCIDPYKNLNIISRNNELAISPCCFIPPKPTNVIDFKNNQLLNLVRNKWEAGVFPEECAGCKNEEALNNTSRRIGSNWWYADNGYDNTQVELVRLDYWTGDLCNLRCAICGPHNSSAWKEELKFPAELKRTTPNYFWKDLDLEKIKFIHFNGGEPLLSKEHILFLKAVPNKSQVHINYNTNGTILPSNDLLALWAQFKLVQLDFSIDDIGDRFEYQRYPAKWAEVTKNLQWFIDNSPHNCMFATNTTISILNYHNIDNLKIWLKSNFYSNAGNDPIEHRFQQAGRLFAIKTVEANKHNIVQFLNDCDFRRGTDWKTVFPELVDTFKN